MGVVEGLAAPELEARAPGGNPAYADLVLPPLATLWLRAPAPAQGDRGVQAVRA